MPDLMSADTSRPHPVMLNPARHLIAVGTIRHRGSRTVTVRATTAGVTGTITSRCPVCRRPFEGCTCTGGAR